MLIRISLQLELTTLYLNITNTTNASLREYDGKIIIYRSGAESLIIDFRTDC